MAAEIEKFSVFDPRIIQTRPKYSVDKGALSVSNVSFQAQTADSSSCQFNVQVPSENVFVDRAVEWGGVQTATVVLSVTPGTAAGGEVPAGTSLQGLVAPAAFPLHQAVSQMSATINDATVTVNTQDVLPQVLRLADVRDARRQRTCPTMLDRYAKYPDSRVVSNSPLLTWAETTESDSVPNGGFNGFYYSSTPNGNTPVDVTNPAQVVAGTGVTFVYGQPTLTLAIASGAAAVPVTLYVVWNSVEKLLLPPFIFSDQHEMSTGLFGVQNFQVQMNLVSSPARALRVSTATTLPMSLVAAPFSALDRYGSVALTSVNWGSGFFAGMWVSKPTLSVQFLTPSLDVPLPPKSIVPYMEFPRYIAVPAMTVPASTSLTATGFDLQSQTITLPNIPDLLLIFVKPPAYADSTNGDWSLPITNISMNFDNFSGLMSTITQEQLFEMSQRNGVDMDWSEWSGYGSLPLSGGSAAQGGVRGLVGGPLVLKPGVDFPLSTGQASGLVGNFTLQFNLKVQNFTGASQTPNIYTIPISSGFFETIKGSSRIIKGVLTEQDILSAPAQAPSTELKRPVGAAMPRQGGARQGGMASYM
jgi:hypothetical protein